MKKLALLLLCVVTFSSCDIEDDGPTIISAFAEVTGNDLPAYFEEGKTYVVEVNYELPTLCHQPMGLHLSRGSDMGEKRRDIYVAGVASFNSDLEECTLEPESPDDLVETTEFTIKIDESEPYTFYFWTGVDSTGENIFETVEIPVGAPELEETE